MSAEAVIAGAKAQDVPRACGRMVGTYFASRPDSTRGSHLARKTMARAAKGIPTHSRLKLHIEQREKRRQAMAVTKAKEKEMKEEKEAERQVRPVFLAWLHPLRLGG